MFCEKCGLEIAETGEFCPNCGVRIFPGKIRPGGEESAAAGVLSGEGEAEQETDRAQGGEKRVRKIREGGKRKKRERSGWAIAALIMGIGAFTFAPVIGAVLAIIFAVISKKDIRRSGSTLGGSYCATAGLTLGILGIVIPIGGVILFLTWGFISWRGGCAARDNLLGAVETARIYYMQNNYSYRGMNAGKILDIDESIDVRDAPGRVPEVVYIDDVRNKTVLMYCYSARGKKYLAAANGDRWRFKLNSREEWEDRLHEFWKVITPFR